jgi:AraC-like DNA-binding protein
MLSEAVSFLLESKNRFDVLPHCPVDRLVRQWLFGVHSFDHDNPVAQHGELQKYVAMALAYYEQLLSISDYTRFYRIKQYIDKSYADPNLDIFYFTGDLAMSTTTIVRRFKKEYGLTIRNYCIQVRMEHAHRLMTQEKYSFTEAYIAVGYIHENSFRKAYKKYLAQLKS